MTITAKLAQAHARLAQVMPHADTLTLPGVMTPGPLDEWDNPTEGTITPGASLPCHASRMKAEDAVKAGLDGAKTLWQVVTNAPTPRIKVSDTLTVTRENGETVALAVVSVSGTNRQVIIGEAT